MPHPELSQGAPWTESCCTLTEPRRTLSTEPRHTLQLSHATLNCSTLHPGLSHAAPSLSYAAPYWATLHPELSHTAPWTEPHCTLTEPHPIRNRATSHPSTEPRRTLYWFTPHPGWATPHAELSHVAPWTESRRTLNWVTLHPHWASLHPINCATPHPELSHAAPWTEPRRTLTEPHRTLNWATPHPELSHAAP
jgi:hypothetical protein